MVFFGDSLSYTGNLNPVIQYLFKLPDSFTNGEPWNKLLQHSLHNKKIDYQDFALPGSTATFQTNDWITAPAFLQVEIAEYIFSSSQAQRENTLAVIWIGFNDYVLQYASINNFNYDTYAQKTIAGISDAIKILIASGCKHFLVLNLGELSRTPFFLALNKNLEITRLIQRHNQLLSDEVNRIMASSPVEIRIFDINGFFEHIKHNKKSYHITNTTESCKTSHKVCSNPDNYFYWDHLHFTENIHIELARSVRKYLKNYWPELTEET